MNDRFGYPGFDAEGVKTVSTLDSDMKLEIKVYRMRAGQARAFCSDALETAVLLMNGRVTLEWDGNLETVSREGIFSAQVWCLHICKGVKVTVTADADSEILVEQADNDREFPSKLYRPEDIDITPAKYDVWESTAKRDIITVFDYHNAPWSNMVIGEVITHPGRWSSYIPHSHEQPEVYYYRYEQPQGFGACFIGDDVYKVTDGSYCAIPGGLNHPQVTAPGYKMYYVWMIRHLPGNPWTERVDDPAHQWLLEE